jgi:hypothetical protein
MTDAILATTKNPNHERVALLDLFLQFLIVGAVSFGGGIIAYERILLVEKRKCGSNCGSCLPEIRRIARR